LDRIDSTTIVDRPDSSDAVTKSEDNIDVGGNQAPDSAERDTEAVSKSRVLAWTWQRVSMRLRLLDKRWFPSWVDQRVQQFPIKLRLGRP
jgi:hypothetical protein